MKLSLSPDLLTIYMIKQLVAILAGASVIGDCHIQSNCWIAADSLVIDTSCKHNQILVGRHPNVETKPAKTSVIKRFFK